MHLRIAAAALGAAALLAGCGGGSSATPGTTFPATTVTPTTTAGVAHGIDLVVKGGKINGDGPPHVTLSKGDEVALKVSADVSDEVHVHGYDLHGDVAPGKPATIHFTASIPGRFEAELESRSLQILRFTVNP
jgi:hypothetical protein